MRKVIPINKKLFFVGISLILLAWLSLDDLVDDWGQIEGAPEKLNTFFSEDLLPQIGRFYKQKFGQMVHYINPMEMYVMKILNYFVLRLGQEW